MTSALEDCITCPITFEHFKTPVSLIPCAHKIEKIWAEKMFGNSKEDGWWSIEQSDEKTCPICRKKVIGYATDHNLKNITELLSKISLSTETDTEKSKNRYPGEPATFIWSPETKSNFLIHYPTEAEYALSFRSINEDSAIENFTLYTLLNSTVFIEVHIREPLLEEFCDYIDSLNVHFKTQKTVLSSTSQEELYALYTIIEKYNTIPNSHLQKLREMIYPDISWQAETVSDIWNWVKPYLCCYPIHI